MVGYRFCCREFIDSIESWKSMDLERTKQQYELAYIETYSAFIAAQKSLEIINHKIQTHGQHGECMLESACDVM